MQKHIGNNAMSNTYFQFKQFTIQQDKTAMKVTTDSCLFSAWVAGVINNEKLIINNCLDIGTGTGLLTLMLAQKNVIHFDAIEIDPDAVEQAKANVAASPWHHTINIIHADVKEYAFENKYDIIISNPPFYENELKAPDKKKNIAHHSENLGLVELLAIIEQQLNPKGRFYLLLPYKRKEEIRQLFTEQHFSIQQMILVRQSIDHDYFRIMLEGKLTVNNSAETMIEEIAIRNESGEYTPAFIDLLKDYYLHL